MMPRFFSYTGAFDGLEQHTTAEAARGAVQHAIDGIDEGWDPEDTQTWCWGEVREIVVVTVVHTHGPECMDEEDGCPEGYGHPEEGQDESDVTLVSVPDPEAADHLNERMCLELELAQAQAELADLRARVAELEAKSKTDRQGVE